MKKFFDTEVKTEVVQRIIGLGFKNFQQDMEIFYIKNLEISHYPAFIDNLLSQRTIKADMQPTIREFLEVSQYTDIGIWNMYRVLYSVDSSSDASYLCILTSRVSDTKISVYMSLMQNNFEVAPDMLILKSSKSSWGGLFSSDSVKIVETPHIMGPEDLQVLLDFFDLIAMQRFMDHFQE
jgi:hypothetical protein